MRDGFEAPCRRKTGNPAFARRTLRRGFTLVEVVVSVVLIGVGIVAVFGAFSSMDSSYYRARESERVQRLAVDKYDEMKATGEWQQAPINGGFEGTDYTWVAAAEPTGYENLMTLTVTVRSPRADQQPVAVSGVVFMPPINGGGLQP